MTPDETPKVQVVVAPVDVADLRERLARVEEAVTNHLPTRIAAVEAAVKGLDVRLWAVLVLALSTLIGLVIK